MKGGRNQASKQSSKEGREERSKERKEGNKQGRKKDERWYAVNHDPFSTSPRGEFHCHSDSYLLRVHFQVKQRARQSNSTGSSAPAIKTTGGGEFWMRGAEANPPSGKK